MEDPSKNNLKEKTKTSNIDHSCNISTNTCIQTNILKQHIRSVIERMKTNHANFVKTLL